MNEEMARKILPVREDDDGLGPSYGHYMEWTPGRDKICLDSNFTIEELEAIIWWIRNKNLS